MPLVHPNFFTSPRLKSPQPRPLLLHLHRLPSMDSLSDSASFVCSSPHVGLRTSFIAIFVCVNLHGMIATAIHRLLIHFPPADSMASAVLRFSSTERDAGRRERRMGGNLHILFAATCDDAIPVAALQSRLWMMCCHLFPGIFLTFLRMAWDKTGKEPLELLVIRKGSPAFLKINMLVEEGTEDEFNCWPLPKESLERVGRVRARPEDNVELVKPRFRYACKVNCRGN